MSENTPKLDLLMKDPVLDGHEYFNVKTMMNDNWEKIDTFADTVDGEVKELQQRLDTEQRKEIALQPGVQIIESDKTVPFRLTGLKGRTLVNLLGRDGNCENIARMSPWQATLAGDTTNKYQGSQSLKITTTALPSGTGTPQGFQVKAGSYYIIISEGKPTSGSTVGAYISGLTGGKSGGNATDTSKFNTVWKAYGSVPAAITAYAVAEVIGPVGSVGYVDGIRVYEITAAEYDALDDMNAEQVGAKYPYVDSVKPVRNPYVNRYGENLLPPFYEWEVARSSVTRITEPYSATITSSVSDEGLYLRYYVPVVAGENYTYSVDISGRGDSASAYVYACDSKRARLTGRLSGSITVPAGASILEVVVNTLVSSGPVPGTFQFANPMLSIGSQARSFVPRIDSMLALQTNLYSDPLTGDNADVVFERDGQYFKNKQWNRVVINDSLEYSLNTHISGVKRVIVSGLPRYNPSTAESWSPLMTKYNGIIIQRGDGSVKADTMNGDAATPSVVYINISNTDSGWGDNYTNLSADEIKAYFMGYKMSVLNDPRTNPYEGSGTKVWIRLDRMSFADYPTLTLGVDYFTTLPTAPYTGYTPYELVYQLATPTVEPITSEGQLTLIEGSNQIDVGSGVVLREKANPIYTTSNAYNINNWHISAKLNYQVREILAVYKNGARDFWNILRFSSTHSTYGNELASLPAFYFDTSASYSVTYLMMDTSPVGTIIGYVPDNEKSLLDDLVQDVQKASARVSVLENKKEDKDKIPPAPLWIKPTLLNSWVDYDTYRKSVGYYKDASGRVHVYGYLKGGISSTGSTVFILPPGFRPTRPIEVSAPSVTPANVTVASTLVIHSQNGNIVCNAGVANGALLLDFSFMTI